MSTYLGFLFLAILLILNAMAAFEFAFNRLQMHKLLQLNEKIEVAQE